MTGEIIAITHGLGLLSQTVDSAIAERIRSELVRLINVRIVDLSIGFPLGEFRMYLDCVKNLPRCDSVRFGWINSNRLVSNEQLLELPNVRHLSLNRTFLGQFGKWDQQLNPHLQTLDLSVS